MQEDIKQTISEVIQRQVVILGPEIAILKAREISGLKVDDKGNVVNVSGDPLKILQDLVDKYVSLSGLIVKKAMEPLIKKHLEIIE